MSMKNFKSSQELRDFVFTLDLMDNRSNIFFNAEIEICTEKNELCIQGKVIITLDDYNSLGRLTIINASKEINPLIFPEIFEAQWQDFKFIEKKYLKIIGNHQKNPNIGKYTVTVKP
jgi:hypothetical protein